MVADYSSFLEFVGAVYFTMSLSEYLTSRIWSPKDKRKFDRALDGLGMKDDKEFKKAVLAANESKGVDLQAELSKKSLIGLFVIAFLLLFCGYEQEVKGNCATAALSLIQLELSYTCVYFIITLFVLQWVMFKKWKYVVFYILSIVGFFAVVKWKGLVYNNSLVEEWLIDNIGIVVCITVSIPILWQIFITWIHKNVFYGYVKSRIREAQVVYNDVQKYIENNEYDKLPHRYHEIYMRKSQAAADVTPQQALDDSLTEYKGVLYNDIRVIGLNVRLYQLLLSWFVYRGNGLAKWFGNLFKSKGKSVVKPKTLQVEDYGVYAKKFKNLKSQKKTIRMKDFCETEKINFDEFNRYYCKYCQSR